MAPPLVSPISNASSSLPDISADKPSAKRPRTARKSISSSDKPNSPEAEPIEPAPDTSGTSSNAAALSAAEDKRRRNTAASARFRAKKKEREAALEKRSKELEGRVSELERECESLRRENGWLKGLVVGVTGASAGAASTSVNMTNTISQGTKRKLSSDEKPANILPIENNAQSL
jgi:hypothetical protein